ASEDDIPLADGITAAPVPLPVAQVAPEEDQQQQPQHQRKIAVVDILKIIENPTCDSEEDPKGDAGGDMAFYQLLRRQPHILHLLHPGKGRNGDLVVLKGFRTYGIHFFSKFGFLFSRKAFLPSFASSVI